MAEEIDRRLERIEDKVDGLTQIVETVAVQKNRIDNVEHRIDSIWSKYDQRIEPMMAQCPKEQVRWLWFVVIPMGLSQLGVAFALIRFALK